MNHCVYVIQTLLNLLKDNQIHENCNFSTKIKSILMIWSFYLVTVANSTQMSKKYFFYANTSEKILF